MAAVMARAALDEVGVPKGSLQPIRIADGHAVFYTYYQISRDDESDEAETEPRKEGELKSRWEGSHSPFGFIWQIASATGWSVDYILNGVWKSHTNLTHPGKYFRPSKVKIMKPTSPK